MTTMITCENGHRIADCSVDEITLGAELGADSFSNFADGLTPFIDGEPVRFKCCPECDAEVFRFIDIGGGSFALLQIHTVDGWRPSVEEDQS